LKQKEAEDKKKVEEEKKRREEMRVQVINIFIFVTVRDAK